MRVALILSFLFSSFWMPAQSSDEFDSLVFGSRNFHYDFETNEVYLRDKDKTWVKQTSVASTYLGETHQGEEKLRKRISFEYPDKKTLRSTLIYEGRPARLRSTVVVDGDIQSIYKCEIDLRAGFFSPSGLKRFRCYYITPKICAEMSKAYREVEGYNALDPKDPIRDYFEPPTENFPLAVAKSLDEEKKEFVKIFPETFRFLIQQEEMDEDDLEVESYRDSYNVLCYGLRFEFGPKLRFKYGQDIEYEENVCPDHARMLLETNKFKETYLSDCGALRRIQPIEVLELTKKPIIRQSIAR